MEKYFEKVGKSDWERYSHGLRAILRLPRKSIEAFIGTILNNAGEFRSKDFDIKKELKKVGGPFIELGGPTATGYELVDMTKLDEEVFVSNIEEGSRLDFTADATKLPFKDASIGAVFISCLPTHDASGEKNEKNTIAAMQESYRVLKPGGYLIYQGFINTQMKGAKEMGFIEKQGIWRSVLGPNNEKDRRWSAIFAKPN